MDMQVKTKYRSAKSCPRVRGKWYGEAMTKEERLKAAKCRFHHLTNSHNKPPSKREVDFAKQKTEGVGLLPYCAIFGASMRT